MAKIPEIRGSGFCTKFAHFLGGWKNRPKSAIFGGWPKTPILGGSGGCPGGGPERGPRKGSYRGLQEGGIQGVSREVTRVCHDMVGGHPPTLFTIDSITRMVSDIIDNTTHVIDNITHVIDDITRHVITLGECLYAPRDDINTPSHRHHVINRRGA